MPVVREYPRNLIEPPPITPTVSVVDSSNANLPGEIKLTRSNILLHSYLTYQRFASDIIESYDNWIQHVILDQVDSRSINNGDGSETKISRVFFRKPTTTNAKGEDIELTPLMCRNNGTTYAADMYADLELIRDQQVVGTETAVPLGKVPVMLGSTLCYLRGKSTQELLEMGECANDPFSYFIIKGNEKVVLMQEKMRMNRFFIFSLKKGEMICRMTCNTFKGSMIVTLYKNPINAIRLELAFLGRDDKGKPRTMPALAPFLILSQQYPEMNLPSSADEILDQILSFVEPKYRAKVRITLLTSFIESATTDTISEAIDEGTLKEHIRYANPRNTNPSIEEQRQMFLEKMVKQLFPNMVGATIAQRLEQLALMIALYVEFILGLRKADDRDSWSNKKVETAGRSLEQLFGGVWSKVVSTAEGNLSKLTTRVNIDAVKRAINPSIIEENLTSSFEPNSWGVKSSYVKENITDILKRESPLALFAHISLINTPTSRRVRTPSIRMVQMSQLGYVDPVETSEGANCIKFDTPVLLPDGTWKQISDLKDGDWVMTFSEDLKLTPSRIYNWFSRKASQHGKGLYKITAGFRSIVATGDHPFFTEEGWRDAHQLRVGDKVAIHQEGISFVPICSIREEEDVVVCDFTTESDNHSMIAAGFCISQCGLVKAKAITARVTIERNENLILDIIKTWLSRTRTSQHVNPLLLNGQYKGWCDGDSLRLNVIQLRRKGIVYRDLAIVLHRRILYINTDASRLIRPLLIVNDNKLVVEEKDLWNAPFDTLIKEQAVEYIDAFEQEGIMLASSIDALMRRKREIDEARCRLTQAIFNLEQHRQQGTNSDLIPEQVMIDEQGEMLFEETGEESTLMLRSRMNQSQLEQAYQATELKLQEIVELAQNTLDKLQRRSYTHCELDPNAIFGVVASTIPLPNHNQAPRNTFQTSMAKQALGIYHSNYMLRFDTTAKTLAFPTRPLFETQMVSLLGMNQQPIGQNVIVAIMTLGGYNQEDALVFNRASIDRGLFKMAVYRSYKAALENDSNIKEQFGRPTRRPNDAVDKYSHLDDNGIARIGSIIEPGQVIIGKIRRETRTGKITHPSVIAGVGEEGKVISVLWAKNFKGQSMVRVKLMDIRDPTFGDKFASRHAQKSTVGLILPEHDMPFTRNGMRPDIVINPHAIPSRMTIAKLIEIVASKVSALSGERVNASAFQNFDIEEFTRNLHQYGYQRYGNEVLYSGKTGRPLQSQIFIGPCYYQALRHHVKDKIQMRSRGEVKLLTRQPIGGRSRSGGLRFGEMERDALISHGASETLTERLCTSSDAYKAVFCKTCGNIAISSTVTQTQNCRCCGNAGKFGTCLIPYAFRLLQNLLAGAALSIRFKLREE